MSDLQAVRLIITIASSVPEMTQQAYGQLKRYSKRTITQAYVEILRGSNQRLIQFVLADLNRAIPNDALLNALNEYLDTLTNDVRNTVFLHHIGASLAKWLKYKGASRKVKALLDSFAESNDPRRSGVVLYALEETELFLSSEAFIRLLIHLDAFPYYSVDRAIVRHSHIPDVWRWISQGEKAPVNATPRILRAISTRSAEPEVENLLYRAAQYGDPSQKSVAYQALSAERFPPRLEQLILKELATGEDIQSLVNLLAATKNVPRSIFEHLRDTVLERSNPKIRHCAYYFLRHHGPKEWHESLARKAAMDSHESVRREAVAALSEMHSSASTGLLCRMLEDSSELVRCYATQPLSLMIQKNAPVREAFIKAFRATRCTHLFHALITVSDLPEVRSVLMQNFVVLSADNQEWLILHLKPHGAADVEYAQFILSALECKWQRASKMATMKLKELAQNKQLQPLLIEQLHRFAADSTPIIARALHEALGNRLFKAVGV